MTPGHAGAPRRLGTALAILFGVAVLTLLGWLVWAKLQAKSDGPPKPPKISLIPVAPPPPPPPPPKEEKRPEPPKEQQEMKVPQPVDQKAPPPPAPGPDLKMEGAAGDGPSAFSSGRVTNENQIPATKGGGGGGAVEVKPERSAEPLKPEPRLEAPKMRNPLEKSGLFNPLANYSRVLKLEAQKHFNQNRALRQRPYRVEVLLWISEDGRPTRAELVAGSGDEETDVLLRESLATLPRFSEVPPTELQLPVRLAITTSGRS